MNSDAVQKKYDETLKRSIGIVEFRSIITNLLRYDEFFFPGYAEMLWAAQEERDQIVLERILKDTLLKIEVFLFDKGFREKSGYEQNTSQLDSIIEILEIGSRHPNASFWQKTKTEYYIYKTQQLKEQNLTYELPSTHLRMVSQVDVSGLQKEFSRLSAHWWLVEVSRQQRIISHRDTRHITIRERPAHQIEFKSFDGIHESIPTPAATVLPSLHKEVLLLAEKLHISLGGVNLVEMNPWSQSFRHWDAERHYTGRNRYHLVLSCGENNTLSSGTDVAIVHEGEVWFFDNKAMHRSHNKSDKPRVHVIFDGFPLSQTK